MVVLLPVSLFGQIDNAIRDFVSDSAFRNAGVSICIRDIESGRVLAQHNKNMALTSASVMKLVTTGVALEILGPDYRYFTRVGTVTVRRINKTKVYIVIKGGGDPTLGSEYFSDHYGDFITEWAEAIIRETGLKEIDGCVIADASVFAYHPVAPGWSWADIGNYYGAGVHGLSAYDNMYRILFKTGGEGSKPEIFNIEPDIPELTITNDLKAYGNRDNGYIYLEPYGKNAFIKGSIPVWKDTFALKASISDPPQLLANQLNKKLRELGVKISEPPLTLRNFNPDPDRLGSSSINTLTESPPLSEIIHVTNRESVNLFAEALVWTLDYVNTGYEGAYLNGGLKVIKEFLESKSVSTTGLYMMDGSGMSRSNAISSDFISSYLAYMDSEARYTEIFKESLAIPGEGTLEPYFLDPVFKGNLSAKSGTMTRARNYAGYLTTKSGKRLTFGVLSNNYDCTTTQVTRKVEALLKAVYNNF